MLAQPVLQLRLQYSVLTMFSVTHKCLCDNNDLERVADGDIKRWQMELALKPRYLTCLSCGCKYSVVVNEGGDNLAAKDISLPKIFAIEGTTGPSAGGTLIKIKGHALCNNTRVMFGDSYGKDVTILDRHNILVTTPPYNLKLNITNYLVIVYYAGLVRKYQPGEQIIGKKSLAVGNVIALGTNYVTVDLSSGVLQSNEQLMGKQSRAFATITNIVKPALTNDGSIIGLTGKATARVLNKDVISLYNVSGNFVPGELVFCAETGCYAKLDAHLPILGSVDVKVINDNGMCDYNGILRSGFTYY